MSMTATQAQQLYVAYFNRPADTLGLAYWMTKDAATASAAFAASTEYAATYAGMSTAARVDAIYTNLFGRPSEPDGLKFWGGLIESGKITVSDAVTAIAKGAQGTDLTAYNNKVKAAEAFTTALDTSAEIVAYSGTTANNAAKVWLTGITTDATLTAATTTAALNTSIAGVVTVGAAVAGGSFALTTAIDNFPGTNGNDTFIGDFGITGQVTSADQINGGNGIDELQLFGTFGTLPTTLTSVEKINLSGYAENKSIDVSTQTGVTDLILRNQTTAGTGDTTVTVAAGQTVTLRTIQDSGNAANELIVASASSVTANTIRLDKAGDSASSGNDLEIEIAGTAVATLNLVTENNASRISLQDETATGDFAVATINVTGDKNLTVDALAASSASKITISAGTFTGALDLNLSATEAFVVTGGSGNDTFNFAGAFGSTDKVAGGAGTDTVAVNTLTGVATWLNGKTNNVADHSSIEVLEYTGTTAAAYDATSITLSGLTTFKTSGVIAATAASGGSGGAVSLAVTNQSNAQIFNIAANITGGVGGAGTGTGNGGIGGSAITFAPAINNGANSVAIQLVGVTITGGTGGAAVAGSGGNGGAGGVAVDFSNYEIVNITSSGKTATAVNTFTGGVGGASGGSAGGLDGATGATLVLSANATINIDGANDINLGAISNSNQPVSINATSLTGKLTVATGTASDVINGGSNTNTITLSGGVDLVDLSKSASKADVITIAAATNTAVAGQFVKIAGFTNVASNGDKLDLALTLVLANDASAGTAAGTGLTASVSNGILTFAGSAAATATLADKVAGVVKAGLADAANEVLAFEHSGNTYVVANVGADNTFTDGTDYLVELTGVTGLTALSLTASAAGTAWVL